jgi:hypothetical protein
MLGKRESRSNRLVKRPESDIIDLAQSDLPVTVANRSSGQVKLANVTMPSSENTLLRPN